MEIGSTGFIFELMCAGGIVESWGDELIKFNKVTKNILIQRSGYATLSYKDVCQVKISTLFDLPFP